MSRAAGAGSRKRAARRSQAQAGFGRNRSQPAPKPALQPVEQRRAALGVDRPHVAHVPGEVAVADEGGDRGFVELLRVEPGTVMPLLCHTGEIHACNLGGTRKLCTGELIGPGNCVYEPPGNTDWWKIVGDEPMLALVVAMGAVEFLGPGGVVTARASAGTRLAEHRRHCREHGLVALDLLD